MNPPARQPMEVRGLLDLVDDHDVFLIDGFGVLRDASNAYPDAPETHGAAQSAWKTDPHVESQS
jgi:hypothetical protein